MNGASPALPLIAALLGSGEPQMVAKRIDESDTRLSGERMHAPVDIEVNGASVGHESSSPCPRSAE